MTIKTVTFSADDLHPYLDVLSLRMHQSTQEQPPLCRVNVADGAIRFETVFRQGRHGAAGIQAHAHATERFEFAISPTRIESFRDLHGDVSLTISDDIFRYTTSGGWSAKGAIYPAALVPKLALPPALGMEAAADLSASLQLCAPFGGGAIECQGGLITAGDAQHSIAIHGAARTHDWVITRDAAPTALDYLKIVGGTVSILGNETKFGLADGRSWIIWPHSVAPVIAPLQPARSKAKPLVFSTKAISTSTACVIAEVGADEWFDLLFLETGEARVNWSHGGESVFSGAVAYAGDAPHQHLRVHGSDLGLLFRRIQQDDLSLSFETRDNAVILTSNETARVGGQVATVYRSAVSQLRSLQ